MSAARSFVSLQRAILPARFDASVCFILITRSSIEEMKSERDRKRGATRNWRNYDIKRLSLRSSLSSRFFLYASLPLLSVRKKENARKTFFSIRVAEVTEVYY